MVSESPVCRWCGLFCEDTQQREDILIEQYDTGFTNNFIILGHLEVLTDMNVFSNA